MVNLELLCKLPRDIKGLIGIVVDLLCLVCDLNRWADDITSEDVDQLLDADRRSLLRARIGR